jgi:hypothetical protein
LLPLYPMRWNYNTDPMRIGEGVEAHGLGKGNWNALVIEKQKHEEQGIPFPFVVSIKQLEPADSGDQDSEPHYWVYLGAKLEYVSNSSR